MQKNIQIEGLEHPIVLARRKGTRSIRLSIKSDGVIRLAVPYGVPEFMARRFVTDKLDWIKKHHTPAQQLPVTGHVGKHHRITTKETTALRPSARITDTEIRLSIPKAMTFESAEVQKALRRACEKALLQEAEHLLPQRLATLSEKHQITYTSCSVKKLKSRWGACDNRNNIVLNIYLMQLEWRLIDYVIIHELAHTIHHHHQAAFWRLVENMLPEYKQLRKELKSKPTDVLAA